VLLFVRRHSGSGVADDDERVLRDHARPDAHLAAGRRVLDRVVEHVPERALEGDRIGRDRNLGALRHEFEAHPPAVREPVRLDERREDAHEIRARRGRGRRSRGTRCERRGSRRPRRHPRERLHERHFAREAREVGLRGQLSAACGLGHEVAVDAQDGQRRLQVMKDFRPRIAHGIAVGVPVQPRVRARRG